MSKRSFKPEAAAVDAVPAKHPDEGKVESSFEPLAGSRPANEESLPDPRAQQADPHAHAVTMTVLPNGAVLKQF